MINHHNHIQIIIFYIDIILNNSNELQINQKIDNNTHNIRI